MGVKTNRNQGKEQQVSRKSFQQLRMCTGNERNVNGNFTLQFIKLTCALIILHIISIWFGTFHTVTPTHIT